MARGLRGMRLLLSEADGYVCLISGIITEYYTKKIPVTILSDQGPRDFHNYWT